MCYTVSSNAQSSKEWLARFTSFLLGPVFPFFRSVSPIAVHTFLFQGAPLFQGKKCGNTWWQQWVASNEIDTGPSNSITYGQIPYSCWLFHIPLFPPPICIFLYSMYISLQLQVWHMRFFWGHFIQCVYLNISNEQFRSYIETGRSPETHKQRNTS